MNCAKSNGCQHRHNRFRNQRHVNNNSISFFHSEFPQTTSETRRLKLERQLTLLYNRMSWTYTVKELLISNFSNGVRYWGVMDKGHFVTVSVSNMSINTIEARIQITPAKPFRKWRAAVINHLVEHLIPGYQLRGNLAPELFRLFQGPLIIITEVITSKDI